MASEVIWSLPGYVSHGVTCERPVPRFLFRGRVGRTGRALTTLGGDQMDPRDQKILACVHGLVHEIAERLEDLESRTSSIEEISSTLVCPSCGTTMVSQPLIMEKKSSPGDE